MTSQHRPINPADAFDLSAHAASFDEWARAVAIIVRSIPDDDLFGLPFELNEARVSLVSLVKENPNGYPLVCGEVNSVARIVVDEMEARRSMSVHQKAKRERESEMRRGIGKSVLLALGLAV